MAGDGWAESAAAWLEEQGEHGDYGRMHVLDGPMVGRIRGRGFRRALDPGGEYRLTRAETMDVAPGSFDLVVSYLSLIDIPGLAPALARMEAALAPGGTLLIANLNGFSTAGEWVAGPDGEARFCMDHYLDERAEWAAWRGMRILNWHRPLGTYMGLLLGFGLQLRFFAEPAPTGGDPARIERHRRAPYFHVMEWEKPGDGSPPTRHRRT